MLDQDAQVDPRERLRLGIEGVPSRPLPTRRRALGLSEQRVPDSLQRRAAFARARELLPALAALLAGLVLAGPGQGLLLGAVVGLVAAPLRRFPMPLHLMPTSRTLLALIPPVIGCGIFVLADDLGPRSFEISGSDALAVGLFTAAVALLF